MKNGFAFYLFTLWTAFFVCLAIDGIWDAPKLMGACGIVLSFALVKPLARFGGEARRLSRALTLLFALVSGSFWLACALNAL